MTKTQANEKYPKRNGFYFFNTPQGELRLPSVTDILKVLDKPALMYWASKESAKIALEDPTLTDKEVMSKFGEISKKASEKGKRIHSLYQALFNNQEAGDNEVDKGYRKEILKFIDEFVGEDIEGEKTVKSLNYGYAGTLDRKIKSKNGLIWIIDFKTSKAVYPEHKLQLEAYRVAEVEDNQKIDRTGVLLVREDGTYSLVETKADFKIFLALKTVWEWVKENE